ncbi:MAG: DUF4202 domain-containing protein [Gammaproteobacteria bacterium]|jgi:hypothetical protein|nr:DUF4202 domain-containing protein [Gammaproteobacteria bacterium]MBT3725289.1 DUF4202 domain-containing protein [Gammaproteobacteria bacterium]MBT4077336.1 DUF4202 domain-containing protein [Gammaproteobacteria bacterium]MBT4195335.1 DUF4202 domain-containing protein [Gammaproteobacteria bacterium]MBT4449638.1 DUF4202 domain-containing protein [Gammaproteobacteria bacterium]
MSLLEKTISQIDAANVEDPNMVKDENGKEWPKELLYSVRMTDMLDRYRPDADDVAKISMRGQHIQRWTSDRKTFPMNRQGYLQWRTQLYKFHANTTATIMQQVGYDEESIERVKKSVGKRGIKVNPDTQLLEDVTDLVFLEHYMLAFAERHPEYDEDKWLDIIRKTWQKMSSAGQQFALEGNIKFPESLVPLIQKAVG